jgi:hypothetical protein
MADLEADDVFGTGTPLDKLCDELSNMYPPTNPSPTDDDRLIMYRSGQRSVVEYILAKKENV